MRAGAVVLSVVLCGLASGCGRIGYDPNGETIDGAAGPDGPAVADDAAGIDAPVAIDGVTSPDAVTPLDGASVTCPGGTTPITGGSQVCVEQVERGNAPWTVARDTCAAIGRRLCADAEWATACTDAGGLVDMANDGGGATPEWEWVAEEAGGVAQKRGFSLCSDTSSHDVVDPYDYRCCLDL